MVLPGRYRHYKGQLYDVLGIAQHSETQEEYVVYRPCYGERRLWIRPKSMFLEFVDYQGKSVARFARIDSPEGQNLWQVTRDREKVSPLAQEWIETVAQGRDIRIERIVSLGHASPDGFWYDQPESEWVTILQGAATLELEQDGTTIELQAGDHLLIPPHCRHRVAWTPADSTTIWLAVFFQ